MIWTFIYYINEKLFNFTQDYENANWTYTVIPFLTYPNGEN